MLLFPTLDVQSYGGGGKNWSFLYLGFWDFGIVHGLDAPCPSPRNLVHCEPSPVQLAWLWASGIKKGKMLVKCDIPEQRTSERRKLGSGCGLGDLCMPHFLPPSCGASSWKPETAPLAFTSCPWLEQTAKPLCYIEYLGWRLGYGGCWCWLIANSAQSSMVIHIQCNTQYIFSYSI